MQQGFYTQPDDPFAVDVNTSKQPSSIQEGLNEKFSNKPSSTIASTDPFAMLGTANNTSSTDPFANHEIRDDPFAVFAPKVNEVKAPLQRIKPNQNETNNIIDPFAIEVNNTKNQNITMQADTFRVQSNPFSVDPFNVNKANTFDEFNSASAPKVNTFKNPEVYNVPKPAPKAPSNNKINNSPFPNIHQGPFGYNKDVSFYGGNEVEEPVSNVIAPPVIPPPPTFETHTALGPNSVGQPVPFNPIEGRVEGSNFSDSLDTDSSGILELPPGVAESSLEVFPNNNAMAERVALPLTITFSPFSDTLEDIPVSDVTGGSKSVVRCTMCKAYLNPYMNVSQMGTAIKCNICGHLSKIRSDYHNESSISEDCIECNCPIYDIASNTEKSGRHPLNRAFVFVIDSSLRSHQSGMFQVAMQALIDLVESGEFEEDKKSSIAIITFDHHISFYTLTPDKVPQAIVVTDLKDPLVPLAQNLLVNVMDVKDSLLQLLSHLRDNAQVESKSIDSCFGSALQCGLNILGSIGGRIFTFVARSPNIGLGALLEIGRTAKAKQEAIERNKENAIWWKNIGLKVFSNKYTSLEFFAAVDRQSYVGLRYIKDTIAVCNGTIHTFFCANLRARYNSFYQELRFEIQQQAARDVIFRLRIPPGWKLTRGLGNVHVTEQGFATMACWSKYQSITAELTFDTSSKRSADPIIYVQLAILHTDMNACRNIRVINKAIKTSSDFTTVIKSLNPEAGAHALGIRLLRDLQTGDKAKAHKFCSDTGELIVAYGAQLRCPSLLPVFRTFAVYALAINKYPPFRSATDVADESVCTVLNRLAHCSIESFLRHVAPPMYMLHNLTGLLICVHRRYLIEPLLSHTKKCHTCDMISYHIYLELERNDDGSIILPDPLPLTSRCMSREGIYLLADQESFGVWIGSHVPDQILMDGFGLRSQDHIGIDSVERLLSVTDVPTNLGRNIQEFISTLQDCCLPVHPIVYCTKEGQEAQRRFTGRLILDSDTSSRPGIDEYLLRCGIHEQN